jgi:hypothetical protein
VNDACAFGINSRREPGRTLALRSTSVSLVQSGDWHT